MLCRSQISRRIGRYSSGGSITPPVWPIGSTRIGRHGRGVLHLDDVADDRGAGDAAVGIALAERASVARRREDVEEARRHRLVHRLARLQPRGRQRAQGRAVPRLVAADDLVLARRAGQPVVLPRQLDRRLDDLGPAALELHRREVAGRQLGQQVGELDGQRDSCRASAARRPARRAGAGSPRSPAGCCGRPRRRRCPEMPSR